MESTNDNVVDFFLLDTYCTVAGDKPSIDTIWFIKVEGSSEAIGKEVDNYGLQIAACLDYIEGQHLEKLGTSTEDRT